jgi:nucleoside-diphosphate-sugar epimerase
MSKCLVTGVAGFIGSSLAERLLLEHFDVIGIDNFTDFYSIQQKRKNLSQLLKWKTFSFYEEDIIFTDFKKLMINVEYVFHFAAHPGVRNGFGENFIQYLKNNIYATQKILEASKDINLKKFIFASSSSVYGQNTQIPISENSITQPMSIYATSKLMTENICNIYLENFGIPITIFRLFTVYGPKQRPDMALYKFICSTLRNDKVIIFGDGNQTRDFTFIDDVVNANILALQSNSNGETFNIGSSISTSINNSLQIIENLTNKRINIEFIQKEIGDVEHTLSDISKAKKNLNYSPKWSINDGIEAEIDYLRYNLNY